jgi:hypothetical protein
MCGFEFDEKVECLACGGCGECRCPVCGYSEPPPSKIATLFERIRGLKDVE